MKGTYSFRVRRSDSQYRKRYIIFCNSRHRFLPILEEIWSALGIFQVYFCATLEALGYAGPRRVSDIKLLTMNFVQLMIANSVNM